MISLQSVFIWLVIALLVGIIAYLLFRKGKLKISSFIASPLLAFYLSFVITITITERMPSHNATYSIMLFWSYRAILNGEVDLISQILWNIVLFLPVGLLLMFLLTCRYKWLIAIGFSILFSACIEVLQLLFHLGLFEFDDIVHNTLGAIIGIFLFYAFRSMLKKIFVKE